jgi:hypothetical protein
VTLSGVDNIRIYSQQVAVPGKTKAQRERELLDARVSRERELAWPSNRRVTAFDRAQRIFDGSLNDAVRERTFGNVRISSPRREVKESSSSVRVLTESSAAPEGRATKARMASMERKGRDWSVSVSTVSLPFATLIAAEPGRLPAHYLLFATAAALAGLSTMILFVTGIRTFTSMCRSWRDDHKPRIIRRLIRQPRNTAACSTRETHAVLPGMNAKTAQEHDYPRERASAPARDYLD